jgi:hypothetical protein
MPNGATVADWLGTAELEAKNAARTLEDARSGDYHEDEALTLALKRLKRATEEVEAMIADLTRVGLMGE